MHCCGRQVKKISGIIWVIRVALVSIRIEPSHIFESVGLGKVSVIAAVMQRGKNLFKRFATDLGTPGE